MLETLVECYRHGDVGTEVYRVSYGIVEYDEDRGPDSMCQILYEVLQVAAPSRSSRSYAVYKVPHYHFQDHFEMCGYIQAGYIQGVLPDQMRR
jgi:hypothetical protein